MKDYTTKDYYKILGLNYNAKAEDIKKAFRRATVKFHPDVNKDGEKIFIEIKEAYEVLIDENERKKYDFVKGYDLLRKEKQKNKDSRQNKAKQEKTNTEENSNTKTTQNEINKKEEKKYNYNYENEYKKSQAGENKNNSRIAAEKEKNFLDTLKSIFSGIMQKNRLYKNESKKDSIKPKDGEDITMSLEISYKEALNGTNRKINVLHTEVCPVCEGKKFTNGSHCKYCKGTGEVSLHKKLNVKIPPHTENNKKIRLKEEGTKGLKGGKNGHLYLVVKITDDSFFKFEENNVLCETEITPFEAALGGEKEIKTLSGMVKLKIPAGTSSGQKFRLAKEGLFDETTKTKGDQIVTIKIKVDNNLSEREKALYKELRNISQEK